VALLIPSNHMVNLLLYHHCIWDLSLLWLCPSSRKVMYHQVLDRESSSPRTFPGVLSTKVRDQGSTHAPGMGTPCWVCVIFFARVVVSERLRRARGGKRGGSGAAPPKNFFFGPTYFRRFRADILSPGRHISGTTYFRDHMILGGFRHMVFCRWFSISG
jgi:hypothetical protein